MLSEALTLRQKLLPAGANLNNTISIYAALGCSWQLWCDAVTRFQPDK